MALASTQIIASKLQLPQGKLQQSVRGLMLPGLLRCLVLTWSDKRGSLLKAAAENESWQAVVCLEGQQFLRSLFKIEAPLTVVDLPKAEVASYAELQSMTEKAQGINESLLVVCGSSSNKAEELWARQLGVWTYLPEANALEGLEMVFEEARKALAKQSTAYCEASTYQ